MPPGKNLYFGWWIPNRCRAILRGRLNLKWFRKKPQKSWGEWILPARRMWFLDLPQFQKFFCLFYRKRKNPPGIPPAPLKKAACGIFFWGGAIAVKNGKCSAAMGATCRNSRDTTGVWGGAWCGPIHPDGAPGAHRRAASTPG